MIELKNLSYSYRETSGVVYALRGIDLSIRRGEWVAVTGANGSGKSTVSRVINGLLAPTEGTAVVCGLDLAKPEHRQQVKRHVQLVFQNPDAQLVGTNPIEDVAFGLENRGVPKDELKFRIEQVLRHVGLERKRWEDVSTLSGGQRQRLAVASCLALEPDCLIFDEATSMLDPKGRREIYRLARGLWAKGITVLWVTQRLEELLEAGRVLVMEQGGIAYDGGARELFYESDIPMRLHWELPAVVQVGQFLKENGFPLRVLPLGEEELEELACELTSRV